MLATDVCLEKLEFETIHSKFKRPISRTTEPILGLFILIWRHFSCWVQIWQWKFELWKFLKSCYLSSVCTQHPRGEGLYGAADIQQSRVELLYYSFLSYRFSQWAWLHCMCVCTINVYFPRSMSLWMYMYVIGVWRYNLWRYCTITGVTFFQKYVTLAMFTV